MTRLPRADDARERMDAPGVDPDALEAALRHVALVNRWLGARRALIRHMPWGLPPGRSRILDVGTGSADLPIAIARWARRVGRRVQVTVVDRHAATLGVARRQTAEWPELLPARADGLQLPFREGAFDLALLSMTLHHMDGPALVEVLAELGRVARGGRVLVGELERALPHYLGARLLAATLWRRNPVTRHDGPLSVLRSFTPGELRELAEQAGLRAPVVRRHLFYRLVLRAEA
jgi:ubiquinone/menaquinone biosynthesis C-methylase UbiE